MKKIVAIGGMLWIFQFVIAALLINSPFPQTTKEILFPLIMVVLGWFCAIFYFSESREGLKQGAIVGIGFILTIFFLDITVTVPLSAIKNPWSYATNLIFFMSEWQVWVGYLLIFAVALLIGGRRELIERFK